MLKELFESIVKFATDQNNLKAQEIPFLRANARRYYSFGAEIHDNPAEDLGFGHEMFSPDSIVEFAMKYDGDDSQLYLSPAGIVYLPEADENYRHAFMKLRYSPQWAALRSFAGGVSLPQSAAIRLFRVTFAEIPEAAAIVDAIRAMRVTATTESVDETARLGKSITRAAVGSQIPESVVVQCGVWDCIAGTYPVRVFMGPNLEKPGEVLLDTDAGKIADAEESALQALKAYFKESEAVENIFIGVPKFILSPTETKGIL